MALQLDHLYFHVLEVVVARLDADLVEGGVNTNTVDVSSFGVPDDFGYCVEILSNGLVARIPKSNSFHQVVAHSVV